jgi:cell wall-associated NlpC family hydrolase
LDIETEALIYIIQYVGLPYIWGGKDPKIGLDCSGLTQLWLDFWGINPQGEHNAQSLYEIFSEQGVQVSVPWFGDLLFFGTAGNIHHVAIALTDSQMLEAAHGDHTVVSPQIAFQKGARVMENPIAHMKDLFAIIRPNGYPWVSDELSSSTSTVPASQGQSQASSRGSSRVDVPGRSPYSRLYNLPQESSVPIREAKYPQWVPSGAV